MLESAADDAITHDRWGYFLSGYAPVKNGDGLYLVGLDMRADEALYRSKQGGRNRVPRSA